MRKKAHRNLGIERPAPPPGPASFFEPFGPRRDEPPGPPPPPPPAAAPPATGPNIWEAMFGPPKSTRAAARPVAPPKPTGPPAFVRPTVDPSKFFDMDALYAHVQALRSKPGWTPPIAVPVLIVANPTADPMQRALDVAAYFRINEAEIQRAGPQAGRVVERFIGELERAINLLKPKELPGVFRFDLAADGSYGMAYAEQ